MNKRSFFGLAATAASKSEKLVILGKCKKNKYSVIFPIIILLFHSVLSHSPLVLYAAPLLSGLS